MSYNFLDNEYDQETTREAFKKFNRSIKKTEFVAHFGNRQVTPTVFISDNLQAIAIRDALRKQIPIEAVKSSVGIFLCPSCHTSIDPGVRYCCYCGQKIEWT